jgi:hypothetical protein
MVTQCFFIRVLTKGTSAEVQIAIRQATFGGSGARSTVIPLEPFSINKEMGRILIRRGGETIAAGEHTCQLSAFARRRFSCLGIVLEIVR